MADKRGRILEHRYVMACALGRSLAPDEVVHHKNHNPRDNRLENLELMTWSAHSKQHNIKKSVTCVCPVCCTVFERTRRTINGKRVFCSRSCAAQFYRTNRGNMVEPGTTQLLGS